MIKKLKHDVISDDLRIGQIHFVEEWLDLHGIPYLDESISKYVYEDGDLAYFKVIANMDKMIEEYKNLGMKLPYFMEKGSEVQLVFRRKRSKKK